MNKLLILLCTLTLTVSCTDMNNEAAEPLIDAKLFEASIENISVLPSNPNNLDEPYVVSIKLKEDIKDNILPEALVLCGIESQNILNRSLSSLIYQGSVESRIAKNLVPVNENSSGDFKSKDVTIGCSFSITTPGEFDENCGEECSDTSLLGGKTWFCVCLYDCSFEIDLF